MKTTLEELTLLFSMFADVEEQEDIFKDAVMWAAETDPTPEEFCEHVLKLLEQDKE